jgi:hypothetical protein
MRMNTENVRTRFDRRAHNCNLTAETVTGYRVDKRRLAHVDYGDRASRHDVSRRSGMTDGTVRKQN